MPKSHDFDLNSWLSGLELSDEDKTLIASKLSTDKNAKYIENSQLQLKDYSAKIQEAARLKTAAEEKEANADRYALELETWKTDFEKQLGGDVTEVAKVKGENAALKAYLERTGVDISTLGLKLDEAPKTEPAKTEPTFDTKGFLTKEQGIALAKWPVVFRNLDAKYMALFGKPMSEAQASEFLDTVMKNGQDPNTLFDQTFKVEERRAELATQERAAWEERTREEIKRQVMSDVMAQRNVPTGPQGLPAPVIEQFGVQGNKNSDRAWNDSAVAEFTRLQQARASGQVQ